MDFTFWPGRRVLVTGHTGFKGEWLMQWLELLNASATGFSLPDDVRDDASLKAALRAAQPEIVFHLAAQALVRPAYAQPAETFDINVRGTVNLLEAVRTTPSVRATVIATSDKVYENQELERGYRETDPLGGYDPYSSSKACAELVASAYRRSYGMMLATARAGNVIGGGDWAADRLVPDCIRAFMAGRPVELRHPASVRPWQHVLDPLSGYLLLAERLYERVPGLSPTYNFGPSEAGIRTVGEVAQTIASLWGPNAVVSLDEDDSPKETVRLLLNSALARRELGWHPHLSLPAALAWTADWYREGAAGGNPHALRRQQIENFKNLMQGGSAADN